MSHPLYVEAITELNRLMDEAARRGEREPRACALATSGPDARPSIRIVGVLRIAESGLAIFVDTKTGKGHQLQANPHAALCFHWPLLEYQAIVEGDVEWLSDADSDALWARQPRDFGLVHWASDQTAPAESAEQMKARLKELKRQFDYERVPRAASWRAFELKPHRIDVWPSGWERMRARVHYERKPDGTWTRSTRNP